MEESKEIEENYIDKLLTFDSKSEAEDLSKIAKGRRFCKIGERLSDIYDQEIEKYKYENSKNIFLKIFKSRRFKQNNKKLLIENRPTSTIRGITAYIIKESKNFLTKEKVIKEVKKVILDKVDKSKG